MDIYNKRLQTVHQSMVTWGLDTVIVTPGAAMRYLTGFSEEAYERLLCLIIPDDRRCVFICPALNAEQARQNPAGITDIRVWDDSQGWENTVKDLSSQLDLDIGIVGVDDNMPARFLLPLQSLLPTTLFKSANNIFVDCRIQKDSGELASMQHAGEISDRAAIEAIKNCRDGISEMDIALVIKNAVAREGTNLSFEPIVAGGPNSALPHHTPTSKKLREGDVVNLDLGARYHGYCGDITRVVSIGEASDETKRVYEVVYEAHQAACEAAKPGVTAHSVDLAARSVIANAGYGEFFIHRTGHGIGLDDHEQPNIVAGSRQILLPGMCFSIEPGIYLPGKFGIRLENIYTITDHGCRSFNNDIPPTLHSVEQLLA
jgi:Xaa-Pro aminopeptidase